MFLTSLSFQDFSSRETDFYPYQFPFSFFRYSLSNFLLSYLYNIFTVYFSGSFPLLKSLSFTIYSFSCLLTFVFIFLSNSATISLVFFRSSSLSQLSYSTINPFHCIRYFMTPLTFLLFSIFLPLIL